MTTNVATQIKTFTRWWDAHCAVNGHNVEDLVDAVRNGFLPVVLMEKLEGRAPTEIGGSSTLQKNPPANNRLQRRINHESFLRFLAQKGIVDDDINTETLAAATTDLVLRLTWRLIQAYDLNMTVEDVAAGVDGTEPLLSWVRGQCAAADGMVHAGLQSPDTAWTAGFSDGRVFSRLIAATRPSALDLAASERLASASERLTLVFDTAQALGVPRLLDEADMAEGEADSRSVVTYVLELKARIGKPLKTRKPSAPASAPMPAAAGEGSPKSPRRSLLPSPFKKKASADSVGSSAGSPTASNSSPLVPKRSSSSLSRALNVGRSGSKLGAEESGSEAPAPAPAAAPAPAPAMAVQRQLLPGDGAPVAADARAAEIKVASEAALDAANKAAAEAAAKKEAEALARQQAAEAEAKAKAAAEARAAAEKAAAAQARAVAEAKREEEKARAAEDKSRHLTQKRTTTTPDNVPLPNRVSKAPPPAPPKPLPIPTLPPPPSLDSQFSSGSGIGIGAQGGARPSTRLPAIIHSESDVQDLEPSRPWVGRGLWLALAVALLAASYWLVVSGLPLVMASLEERAARLEAEAEARRAAASGGFQAKVLRGGAVLLLLAAVGAFLGGVAGGVPGSGDVDEQEPASGGRGRGRKKNASPARKRHASPSPGWNRRPTNQRMRRDNTRYPD